MKIITYLTVIIFNFFVQQESWPSPNYLHGEPSAILPSGSPYPPGCHNPVPGYPYGYEDKQHYCPVSGLLDGVANHHHGDSLHHFQGTI